MNEPTKPQLTFLGTIADNQVTVVALRRAKKSFGLPDYIITKIYFNNILQHPAKLRTANICLENGWINLYKEDKTYIAILTESGFNKVRLQ